MRCTAVCLPVAMVMAIGVSCTSEEPARPRPGPAQKKKPKDQVPKQPAPEPGIWLCTEVKDDQCVDPETTFKSDAEVIHVRQVGAGGQKKGQEYSVRWIAEDVGKVAPPNFKIDEYKGRWLSALKGVNYYKIAGSLPRPPKGWPLGRYRVEVRVGAKLVATQKFKIEIAVKLSQVFEDKDLGFAIKYPANWIFNKPSPDVVVFSGKDPASPEYYSTVEIKALSDGRGIAKQMALLKKQLQDPAKKGRVFDEQPFALSGEGAAVLKGLSLKAEYQLEEVAFVQWQLVVQAVKKRKLVFTWAYTAHRENFERHLPVARAMLDSWRLLD